MSCASRSSSFRRLLQAARGTSNKKPLPFFPLKAHHVESLSPLTAPTPQDFHARLCDMIRNAKHRVHLASLYVGTGNGEEEREFLDALASVDSDVQVRILLDENRATRLVKSSKKEKTSSAEAVYQSLQQRSSDCGVYLFPALPEPRRSLLPSPLNEIAGVFHIKAYVIDDELILSGANISEEYFSNRQDRYLLFINGGGGLVDFYCNLMDVLRQYGYQYRSSNKNGRLNKRELKQALEELFDGSKVNTDSTVGSQNDDTLDAIAYAVPTFQAPEGFFSTSLDFLMDAELTRNVLATAHEMDASTNVQLASAYLNPTPKLTSALARFDNLRLLTAGPKSHGFAVKPGKPRRGDWIPSIFSALYAELEGKLPHVNFLYYERDGWTFHAKGLWITRNDRLQAAVVGSGNYGARSEAMDVESNTILLFPSEHSELQTRLECEWDSMCQYAHAGHAIEFPETSWRVKAALPIIRDLF